MPEGRVLSRIWAFSIQTLWTMLYTWYRFDYYENATVFGRILNRLGAFLSIPMERAVSFMKQSAGGLMVRECHKGLRYGIYPPSGKKYLEAPVV